MHKTVAEVDLNALTSNLNVVREKTGNKDILAVVKAGAYGHGAISVSQHLIKQGISGLGVAFTSEAVLLRKAGIHVPILVFFDRDNSDACLEYDLTPVVFDVDTAEKLSSAAGRLNRRIPVHVKVDTGMGRVGFTLRDAREAISRIALLKHMTLEGLMSHFSEADLQDKGYAEEQIRQFSALVEDLKKINIQFRHLHMANSAAVLTLPGGHFNMVRPGIMLYGYGCCESERLKPVMSVKSSIVMLKNVPAGTSISYSRTFVTKRESTIATVPAGYADGYSRKLSNSSEVLISGRRAPVLGRVCMDTIMVDVTDIPDVSYRSDVVLIGSQGAERITADDIADRTGTIPYEVLTSIGPRVKRVYT